MSDKQANFGSELKVKNNLSPLKIHLITNFPFIEADFDALTEYQLLSKVVEYLNNVVKSEQDVTEQTIDLYNAYNNLEKYVNEYYKDLDVINFELLNRQGLISTYRVTFYNNEQYDFSVRDGNGIEDIEVTQSGLQKIIIIRLTDGTEKIVRISDAKSIVNIELESSVDLIDTYKITFSDLTTFTYQVKNGATGPQGPQGPQGEQGPAGKDGTINFSELTEDQKEELRNSLDIELPIASNSVKGIVQGNPQKGISINDGVLSISSATDMYIENMTNSYNPITPVRIPKLAEVLVTKKGLLNTDVINNSLGLKFITDDVVNPDNNGKLALDFATGDEIDMMMEEHKALVPAQMPKIIDKVSNSLGISQETLIMGDTTSLSFECSDSPTNYQKLRIVYSSNSMLKEIIVGQINGTYSITIIDENIYINNDNQAEVTTNYLNMSCNGGNLMTINKNGNIVDGSYSDIPGIYIQAVYGIN